MVFSCFSFLTIKIFQSKVRNCRIVVRRFTPCIFCVCGTPLWCATFSLHCITKVVINHGHSFDHVHSYLSFCDKRGNIKNVKSDSCLCILIFMGVRTHKNKPLTMALVKGFSYILGYTLRLTLFTVCEVYSLLTTFYISYITLVVKQQT